MQSSLPKLAFLTNMPSYYQIDFFDAIATSSTLDIRVFYHRQMSYGRNWHVPVELHHDHKFIREIRLRKHLYLSPGSYLAINEYLPDLLVVCQYSSPATQVAMWLHTLRKLPWVFWSEAPGVEYADDPIVAHDTLRKAFRTLSMRPLAHAQAVWGIGKRATQIYKHVIQDEKKCFNLPYYSDLSGFHCNRVLNPPDHKCRFLFSGSLSVRKGFDLLLEAVEHLVEERILNFEVVILGTGPLEKLISTMSADARSHVCFMGFQQLDRLPEIYSTCDVLIFPSRYDGWGMVLQEAMSSGMPVIASINAGATHDLVKDHHNGFIININDLKDISTKMKFFIGNPAHVFEMGRQAQTDVDIVSTTAGVKKIEELVAFALK